MTIDGTNPSAPIKLRIFIANVRPKIEWTIAKKSGAAKNMAIWRKRARLIILSSAPKRLNIIYFSRLSDDSDNYLSAKIAALEMRKMIPRYKPRKTAIA